MNLESNFKKYYYYKFFKTLSFWLPIFVIYYLANGLDYSHIMILMVVEAAFQIIFEIPSGVFADFFGRKYALSLAAGLHAVSIFIFFLGNSFWPFLLASAIFGMSLAFSSGSNSAFVYDTLKDLKREKEYKKIEGKGIGFGLLGMGVGSFFGGFIAEVSLKIPIIMTMVASIIAVWISLYFIEPKLHKKSEDTTYFKHMKVAAVFSFKHPSVRWLIIFSGFMMVVMMISHRFFQPYMQLAGIDIKFFGVIYLVWLLICTFGSFYAHKIESKLGEFWSLMIIPLFLGIHLIINGSFVFFLGITVIFMGEFTYGFLRPIICDYINKHVESYHRATVLSFQGFFRSIVLIILAPVFGYLADALTLTNAMIIEGIVALAVGIPVVFMIVKSNKKIAATA
ncbi:MAG: MFS transporter [archaeon]